MDNKPNKPHRNVIDAVNKLLTKQDYISAMQLRGIISLTVTGLATLEREGIITLDYVAVGRRLFIPDTAENQERMAALQKRRDDRAARGLKRRPRRVLTPTIAARLSPAAAAVYAAANTSLASSASSASPG